MPQVNSSFCRRCHTAIAGASNLCVSCFRALHRPCPNCMNRCGDGRYRVRKRGRGAQPVSCGVCANERFILAEEGNDVRRKKVR